MALCQEEPPAAIAISQQSAVVITNVCANGEMGCSRELASQVYRWDFNVFDFTRTAGGRPLFSVTMTILEQEGLLDGWLLDRSVVERYVRRVESMYKPNPYHNNTHAADVTQTAAVIMRALDRYMRSKSGSGLSKSEKFAIVMASAVHDLGHPGVNNAFLIRTRDSQAITYNDKSVNEMMHASLAFRLALENEDLNIFARFSDAEFELVRKLVVEMVLSTDMDVHFALLKRFDDAVGAQPCVSSWSTVEQRSLIFQMLVHLADLANPSRPWHLALTWAEWVVTEFMQQGEKEAAAGLSVSDMCNRDKVCMPAAQLFFIERFMQPTLEAFRPAVPSFYALALPWLTDTKARWVAFKEAGVKLPRCGYPESPQPLPQLAAALAEDCCCSQQQQHQQQKQQEQI